MPMYLLIGLALLIFYSILLSLSEYILFQYSPREIVLFASGSISVLLVSGQIDPCFEILLFNVIV
ncbi:hypothetical protein HGB07_03970, partial [Candidatus Roizmanbacteria bacterium]|nr:hypothetical protein [Candidatus Roizmanbacteria bacterium]